MMKKFIIHIVLFSVLLLAVLGGIFAFCPKNPDGYMMEYKDKCELMRTVPNPRIIFVGGSNLAFGLDSKRIADSLNVSVINFGLQAGLGLKFILDDMVKYVRQGDIIVVAPEYVHFYGKGAYGEQQTLPSILDVDLSFSKDFDQYQWTNILKGLPALALGRLDYLKSKSKKEDSNIFLYKKSGFNAYGDEESHWNKASIPVKAAGIIQYPFNEEYFLHFVSTVGQLQQISEVMMIPPAIDRGTFENQKSNVVFLQEKLKGVGLDFIANPSDFAYPSDCIFNTNYHLNKKGVDRNTTQVIQALMRP